MYNFSELITSHVVIQKFKTKHPCKANFSVAVQVCRQLLLGNVSPPDVEAMRTLGQAFTAIQSKQNEITNVRISSVYTL